jgi:toxin ParE1/3/4
LSAGHLVAAAVQDLEAIGDYVARDKPAAALRLVRPIFAGIEALGAMPHRCRSGRIERTRELVLGSYIAVYEVQAQRLFILHIYHAAQDWPVSIDS